MGEKSFQKKDSQILVARNRFYPPPIPYPKDSISSRYITIIEARVSYSMIKTALVKPISLSEPYIPVVT